MFQRREGQGAKDVLKGGEAGQEHGPKLEGDRRADGIGERRLPGAWRAQKRDMLAGDERDEESVHDGVAFHELRVEGRPQAP